MNIQCLSKLHNDSPVVLQTSSVLRVCRPFSLRTPDTLRRKQFKDPQKVWEDVPSTSNRGNFFSTHFPSSKGTETTTSNQKSTSHRHPHNLKTSHPTPCSPNTTFVGVPIPFKINPGFTVYHVGPKFIENNPDFYLWFCRWCNLFTYCGRDGTRRNNIDPSLSRGLFISAKWDLVRLSYTDDVLGLPR